MNAGVEAFWTVLGGGAAIVALILIFAVGCAIIAAFFRRLAGVGKQAREDAPETLRDPKPGKVGSS